MSYRKRKRENRHQTPPPAPDLNLLIQAHEAEVICGPQAERAAAYLEMERRDENTSLIRWAASGSQAARPTDSALRIHDDGDSFYHITKPNIRGRAEYQLTYDSDVSGSVIVTEKLVDERHLELLDTE